MLETWRATLNLIRDRPWLGVGAGNFSRAFPRFQGPGSGAPVADPHNFLLEIAATGGVLTLAAVLTALGAFFVQAGRGLFRPEPDAGEDAAASETGERIAWEYYLGGMCGLVLGLILRMTTGDYSPGADPERRRPRLRALPRLVDGLRPLRARPLVRPRPRRRPGRRRAAAALVVLSVSPGIGLPTLTVPLWAAVALGLNALPQPANAVINRFAVARILPLPVVGVVGAAVLPERLQPRRQLRRSGPHGDGERQGV